jgi:repressor LexA
MQTLTAIQQAVYDYTRQAMSEGLPFPSLRGIAAHFGFKHTTARFHLKALEKKGFIRTSELFSVDHAFFGGGDIQAIRVAGESMSGDSIADGDIAMIKLQSEANKGDILAVRIEDEITLKRIKLVGDRCQLIPSNPEFSVREVPARHLQIIGKLVGVIRKT